MFLKRSSPIIIILLIATVTITAYTALTATKIIPLTGYLKIQPPPTPPPTLTLQTYTDPAATIELKTIEWGDLQPGYEVTRTIYLKNTGNTKGTLTLETSNRTPPTVKDLITLTWNREGATLNPDEIIDADLTLKVSLAATEETTFTGDIIITLTET